MRRGLLAHVLLRIGTAVLAVELTYAIAANALLWSGVIQSAANPDPAKVFLDWESAWSPWPGRVYVQGFVLRVQDPVSAFRIAIPDATADLSLSELLHQRVRVTDLHATGVSYRFIAKVEKREGSEARLAAFALADGLEEAGVQPVTPPPPLTAAELASLWDVQLDRIDATFDELWFVEFRYQGPAHLAGSLVLAPLRNITVGPTVLTLDGGLLTTLDRVVADDFEAAITLEADMLDLPSSPGLRMIHTLSATVRFASELEDLGAADLYYPGLHVSGEGRVEADLRIEHGELLPGSRAEAWLPDTEVLVAGGSFVGESYALLSVVDDGLDTSVEATLTGTLTLPLQAIARDDVAVKVQGAKAELLFVGNMLSEGLALRKLSASVGEARVPDARSITSVIGDVVPLVAKPVLGDGPLVAAASLYLTPEYTLVRLRNARLGDAAFEGAAVAGSLGWSGAIGGHFGPLPLGLRLRRNNFEGVPFIDGRWLDQELERVGIEP